MRRQVDQFAPGQWVPSCQLYVKWTGQQEQPVELVHRVELLGAKEPFNFFSIRPPSLMPPPQLPQGMHTSLVTRCQWKLFTYYFDSGTFLEQGRRYRGGKGGLSPPTFKSRGAEPPQNNRLDGTFPRNLALTNSYVTSFLGDWRL